MRSPACLRSDPETLAAQMKGVRRMVARRTARLGLQWLDREEIVSAVMERLVLAQRRGRDLEGVPEALVIGQNVDWAVADFCRAAMRRSTRERLTEPEQMPERPAPTAPVPAEEREALRTLLGPLTARERQILFERYVLDLPAGEVADRCGMQVGAIKMACTRAIRRAREASRL